MQQDFDIFRNTDDPNAPARTLRLLSRALLFGLHPNDRWKTRWPATCWKYTPLYGEDDGRTRESTCSDQVRFVWKALSGGCPENEFSLNRQ